MIKVKGVAEAQAALQQIIDGLDDLNEETLKKVGELTLDLVRSRTPIKTGRLVRGHRFKMTGEGKMEFSNDVPYSGFVEFGTSRQQPQPHWRPALEAAKREFPRLYAKDAKKLAGSAGKS